jgi:two-component system KDP operon response regulator KdpE
MGEKILIIDDDALLLRMIHLSLQSQGFSVFTAIDGEEGLTLFHQIAPDLVILDIMMPGMDGWEVCGRLRQISPVPIIFLTALGSEENIVDGLMEGADDYLVKPFTVTELRARVVALLRRARMSHHQSDILRFGGGDLVINRDEQAVLVHGHQVKLSPTEYDMLLFMAERAGRILPPQLIFDAVWAPWADARPQSVKWYVWRLRQKIEANPQQPRFILTERGKGYRFSLQ